MPSSENDRSVRVLQSVRPPARTTNPYVVQLVDALEPLARVEFFSWSRALRGGYDVLHVHWPEVMLRRGGRAARALAQARFALLMLRLRATGTPLVRTLHNVRAHEQGSRLERFLLGWCERLTSFWILLNDETPVPTAAPSRVIVHGDYRRWFARHPVPEPVPGRVLNFGLIRPYKGVDTLLAAFAELPPDPPVTLRISGQPNTDQLRDMVTGACERDPRISADLDYVDDETLAAELGRAQLVALPYREMHNSGALLLALSLNRPVLVPDGEVTRSLDAEVGPGWVLRHHGELTPDALARAVRETAGPRQAPPDLSARDWDVLAAQHAEVYRQVAFSPAAVAASAS